MKKYLQELIEAKGLNAAYKECVHMIDSLRHNCYKSDSEKLADIVTLLGVIEEAEVKGIE